MIHQNTKTDIDENQYDMYMYGFFFHLDRDHKYAETVNVSMMEH